MFYNKKPEVGHKLGEPSWSFRSLKLWDCLDTTVECDAERITIDCMTNTTNQIGLSTSCLTLRALTNPVIRSKFEEKFIIEIGFWPDRGSHFTNKSLINTSCL